MKIPNTYISCYEKSTSKHAISVWGEFETTGIKRNDRQQIIDTSKEEPIKYWITQQAFDYYAKAVAEQEVKKQVEKKKIKIEFI